MMKRASVPNTKKRTAAPASTSQRKTSKVQKSASKIVKAPPRADTAYSLYSISSDSESDDAQKLNKDLNKCAQLLTDMLDREPGKAKNASRPKKPSRSKSKSRTDRRTEDKPNHGSVAVRSQPKQTNRNPLTPADNNIQEAIPSSKGQADMLYASYGQPSTAFNHRLSSSTPEAKNQQQYNADQNCPPRTFIHPNSAETIRKERLKYTVQGQNGYPSPHVSPNANYQYQVSPQGGVTANVVTSPVYHGYGPTSNALHPEPQPPFHIPEDAQGQGRMRHRSSTFPVDTETFKNLADKHFQTTNAANVPRPASVGPTDATGYPNQGLNHAFIPRDDYYLQTKGAYQSPNKQLVQFEFEQPVRDTEGQVPVRNGEPAQNYQTNDMPVREALSGNFPASISAPFVSVNGVYTSPNMVAVDNQHFQSAPGNYPSALPPASLMEGQHDNDLLLQDSSQDVTMTDLRSESTFVPHEIVQSEEVLVDQPGVGARQFNPMEVRSRYASIRYLIGELRALAGGDAEFKRIVSELETSINSVSPVKGAINLQAEIDLALQPLRSENCQLRRRLRIVNTQLKERERKEKENIKPDNSFEFAHLHAKYSSLQQKFNEEREKNSGLQNKIYQLEGDVEAVKTDRQKMMLTLSEKDTDQMKTRHDWLQETTKLKKDLDSCNKKIDDLKIKLEASERERHINSTSLQQRDVEVNRMTDLLHEYKLRYDPSRPQTPFSNRSSPAGQGTSRLTRQALEEFNKTNQPAEKVGSPLADMEVRETYSRRSPKVNAEQNIERTSPFRPTRFDARPSPQGFEGSVEEKRSPNQVVQNDVHTKSKTVSFMKQLDDQSSVVSSVSEKVSRRSTTPPFVAISRTTETTTCTPLTQEPTTPRSDTSAYSRYSVTDYFNKYPQGQFRQYTTGSYHMESTRQQSDLDTTVLSSVTSSFDDGKSIGSESTITSSSVSSINSQDDRTFREGLANLDANIARLQSALKKTSVR
ncbi:uncharacterized protein LOC135499587 [Lineus longissimus]|uniref:uncharacterized protein LOC135499587 n=1 Tax=Lineus longissimus TaxID=88925 RepID=UPI002B4F6039